MSYIPTIGLEIHAELKTATKMFCGCKNDPDEKHPNINVCPVCLAHPGTLPVPNREAIEAILKIGMAVGGDLPAKSKFDRKSYFYPDLPKGYQISQYDQPLVVGGRLAGVRLMRVHLEEDTGRLLHGEQTNNDNDNDSKKESHRQKSSSSFSLVDFNRAGVPLMELVTEPDVKDADQAVEFARELQLILRYLGSSDADMEKGQMRVEANISIKPLATSDSPLGTKVEVKNINSFKAAHDAIEYEIKRQTEILDRGEAVMQETRGWDENKGETFSQRSKESAHEYRYFPAPDIPPLDLSKFDLTALKRSIPELPAAKRTRFAKEFGLKPEQVEILIADREAAAFFEAAVSELKTEDPAAKNGEIQLLINYLVHDLRGLMAAQGIGFAQLKLTAENFIDLIELVAHGKINSRTAKDLLARMVERGGDPNEIMRDENLAQVSDEGELTLLAQKLMTAHLAVAADYRRGKTNALQFFVGKAMAELKGKGNPQVLQKIFKEVLGGD